MADDARSLPNTAMLETSFLYGANDDRRPAGLAAGP